VSAETTAAPPAASPFRHRADWLLPVLVLGPALAGIVFAAIITPTFLTGSNILAIVRNASIIGIIAVAMTPMTLSGNFVSLGIAQSAMVAEVSFIAMVGAGWGQPAAIVLVLLGTLGIGALQGAVVAAGFNPVITTLAAGAIMFGVVSEITQGRIVNVGEHSVSWGGGDIGPVPIVVIVFVVFTALVTLVTSRTVVGRRTFLVGANRAAAEISGISFGRVTVVAFLIFSLGVAIVGILEGAAFGEATAKAFPTLTISVIAALLVGGTAIGGGQGSPLRSAAGALLISVISNMMVLNDFSPGGRLAIQGAVVAAAVVILDMFRRRGLRR
jgi:ribose transport system permease protein